MRSFKPPRLVLELPVPGSIAMASANVSLSRWPSHQSCDSSTPLRQLLQSTSLVKPLTGMPPRQWGQSREMRNVYAVIVLNLRNEVQISILSDQRAVTTMPHLCHSGDLSSRSGCYLCSMIRIHCFLLCMFIALGLHSQGLELHPLTGDVYLYTTYQDYEGNPVPANGLYVVTDAGVLLIDTPWDTTE